jgi:hypothetical protein
MEETARKEILECLKGIGVMVKICNPEIMGELLDLDCEVFLATLYSLINGYAKKHDLDPEEMAEELQVMAMLTNRKTENE